jgi:hypothetical protein
MWAVALRSRSAHEQEPTVTENAQDDRRPALATDLRQDDVA